MKMWMAVKRLNRRFDCWSARAADKMAANLDNVGDRQKLGTIRHISVWDLPRIADPARAGLPRGRECPGEQKCRDF